jgi:maleylpyruvate isomerase
LVASIQPATLELLFLDVQHDPASSTSLTLEVGSCAASQAALITHVRSVADGAPSAPSMLPGWSRGHVLTHIARNGDSHVVMLDGRPQYPSAETRNRDIDLGAERAWADLVEDVESASSAVDRAFAAQHDWSGTASTIGGQRPLVLLPLLRQREVEVHRVDLDLGYGFADMPTDYVDRDLIVMETMWASRQPAGTSGLPDEVIAAEPWIRLAWLMGRADIAGVGAAAVF